MGENYIYLNNAATTFPKPPQVVKDVELAINSIPEDFTRTGIDEGKIDIISSCRKELSAFFNIEKSEQVVFTSGGTESINMALAGLNLKDQHVITSSIEHNSVLRPLKHLEADGKIELSIVDCDSNGQISPQNVLNEIKRNTKLVVLNHCSNVTGCETDIETIGNNLQKYNNIIFLVDASQSAGTIPIDVQRMKIDLLVFTGHKSLFGYSGIGGLFIREGLELLPLKTGGTGIKSELLFQPQTMPIYYEAGTKNFIGIASLYSGIKFIKHIGIDKIRHHKKLCVEKMMSHLAKIKNIVLYPQSASSHKSTIFSFNIKDIDPADVGYVLQNSFKIITRSGLHCAPLVHKTLGSLPFGTVRISPSYFTTDRDINLFNNAITAISKAN